MAVSVLYVEKNQNKILRNISRFLTSRFRQIAFLMTCQQHKSLNQDLISLYLNQIMLLIVLHLGINRKQLNFKWRELGMLMVKSERLLFEEKTIFSL